MTVAPNFCRIQVIDPWYGSEERCGYARSEQCLSPLVGILMALGEVWEPTPIFEVRRTFVPVRSSMLVVPEKKPHQQKIVEFLQVVAPVELAEYVASICGIDFSSRYRSGYDG